MLVPPCCLCLKTEERIDKSGTPKRPAQITLEKPTTVGDRKKQGLLKISILFLKKGDFASFSILQYKAA